MQSRTSNICSHLIITANCEFYKHAFDTVAEPLENGKWSKTNCLLKIKIQKNRNIAKNFKHILRIRVQN